MTSARIIRDNESANFAQPKYGIRLVRNTAEHHTLLCALMSDRADDLAVVPRADRIDVIADIVEILNTLASLDGITEDDVLLAAGRERARCGGYSAGLVAERDDG